MKLFVFLSVINMAGKCGASCNETHDILAKTFIHNTPGNAGFSFGDNFARMKFYFGQFNIILSIRIKSYRISSTPILSHPPCRVTRSRQFLSLLVIQLRIQSHHVI